MRLKEIYVQGFRAFNAGYTFQFDPKMTLFVGMNGTGKTSLCDAIQFGIIGKLPQYKGIEEATKFQDMVINRNNSNKKVEVSLSFDDGSFITRKKTSKALLKPTQGVDIFRSKGAPSISYEDFRSTVYLRQEQIRRFIEADRKIKEQELSALLGVEAVLGIAEGVKQFTEILQTEIKKRQRDFEEIKRKAKTWEEKRGILLTLKRKIMEKWGLREDELAEKITVSHLVSASQRIQKAFIEICQKLKLDITLTEIKEDIASVVIFVQELRSYKDSVYNKIRDCREAIYTYNILKKRLEELGDKELINKEINEIRKKINANREKTSCKEPYIKLIADAKIYLKQAMPKDCPVCGRSIEVEAVIEHLDKVERKEIEEIQRLEKEITDLNTKEQSLQSKLKSIGEIEDQLSKLKSQYLVEEDYSKVEQKFHEMIKEFEQIVDLLDFRNEKADVDGLSKEPTLSTEELERYDKMLKQMMSLARVIEILNDELQRRRYDFINQRLKELDPYINNYVKILSPHPRFSNVRIRYENGNFWLKGISDSGEEVYARALFSTAQLNETAIILLLAMANTAKHKLDFIILDDPSQSLDSKGKENLAKLLAKVAESKQLIICTMDTEFAECIKNSFPAGKFYLFEEYTERGPVVKAWNP